MMDPKILDDLAKRFSEAVPPGIRQLQADLEKNFRATLQTAFTRMDLVTREEFDVQQAVLARTRARLEELERQVTQLEARLSETNNNTPETRKSSEDNHGATP